MGALGKGFTYSVLGLIATVAADRAFGRRARRLWTIRPWDDLRDTRGCRSPARALFRQPLAMGASRQRRRPTERVGGQGNRQYVYALLVDGLEFPRRHRECRCVAVFFRSGCPGATIGHLDTYPTMHNTWISPLIISWESWRGLVRLCRSRILPVQRNQVEQHAQPRLLDVRSSRLLELSGRWMKF